MKASARSLESSVELPGVSERRPLALPIDTPPKAEQPVFVYSPLRVEWTIGVCQKGDGSTALRAKNAAAKHWMPLLAPLKDK